MVGGKVGAIYPPVLQCISKVLSSKKFIYLFIYFKKLKSKIKKSIEVYKIRKKNQNHHISIRAEP